MNAEEPVFHKPQSFLTARRLFYANFFVIGLTYAIQNIFIGPDKHPVTVLFILLVWIAIILSLISQMNLCKKWARTAITVLYSLAAMGYAFNVVQLFKRNAFLGALSVINTSLYFLAFVFLFQKDSNDWFNSHHTKDALP